MDLPENVGPMRSTVPTPPRSPRVPITVAVQHHAPSSHEVMVDYAQDISTSGLFLACKNPYTVGTMVELDISNAGDDGQHIHAQAHVVRVGVGSSGQYGMGISFLSLDRASRKLVEHIVSTRLARG